MPVVFLLVDCLDQSNAFAFLWANRSVPIGRFFGPIKCFPFLWAVKVVFLLVDCLDKSNASLSFGQFKQCSYWSIFWNQSNASLSFGRLKQFSNWSNFWDQPNASLSFGQFKRFLLYPPSALLAVLSLSFSCSYRCTFFLGAVGGLFGW